MCIKEETSMLQLGSCTKKVYIYILIFTFFTNIFALQLGDGGEKDTLKFIKVEENAKSVISLVNATFIIKKDNSLWGTGYRIFRLLGMTGEEYVHSYVKLMDNVKQFSGNFLIKTDDSLWRCSEEGIFKISDNVKKVSQGDKRFCLYITNDNTLYGYGYNEKGAFGNGIKVQEHTVPVFIRDDVIDVYTSGYSSLVVTGMHELLITGAHYLPDYKTSSLFFKLAENVEKCGNGFYISQKGDLYSFGYASEGALGVGIIRNWKVAPTKILSDVADVSSDQQATLILKKDGSLYGCGGKTPNYYGELGFGNKNAVLTPQYITSDVAAISVQNCHSVILKKDGSVWACGANSLPALM